MKCKIVDNRDLASLSKMTKKKGDANTLTLTFETDNGNILLWKFTLEQSLQLCNDITLILSSLDYVCLL